MVSAIAPPFAGAAREVANCPLPANTTSESASAADETGHASRRARMFVIVVPSLSPEWIGRLLTWRLGIEPPQLWSRGRDDVVVIAITNWSNLVDGLEGVLRAVRRVRLRYCGFDISPLEVEAKPKRSTDCFCLRCWGQAGFDE